MGTSNGVFRLPVRVHQSPTRTPQGDLHTASQGQRQAQGAAVRSQPAPPQECGREGHTRADSFPLSLLPYNEEIGRLATYPQPQETRQMHQATSVQDGVVSSRPSRTTTQLVGRQSRPEGCLPPHSHPSFFQKMAGFHHRRRELPLQVSPIRTLHGSSDIHQGGQSHSRTSQEARRVRLYLPRRLATDSTISRDPARSGSHDLRPSTAAGFHRQLPEVDASTLPEGTVPRVAPGLYERNGVPHRRTSPECNPLCSSTTTRGDTSSPSLDENAGPHRQPQVYATSEDPKNAGHPAACSRQIQKPQRQSLPQDQQDNTVSNALLWWTQPSNVRRGKIFAPLPPASTLTTDASKAGWGAHWRDIQLSGTWSPLAKKHINLLELWAIHLALRRLRHHLKGTTVLVKCDNMSVVMYINKRGGVRSRSLCLQTILLLKWCQRYQITLQAAHLPGAENKLADALSRKASSIQDKSRIRGSSVEWHLNPIVCRTLFNRLQRPLIDQFASSRNKQLPTFCSWGADPMAFAQNAMAINWNMTMAYAFPPIALIPRMLEKIANSKSCDMILIAPRWPRQPWFPRLLSLLVGEVIVLPIRKDLILTEDGAHLPRQTLQALNLTAWQISSSHTRRQAFQAKLQPWRGKETFDKTNL